MPYSILLSDYSMLVRHFLSLMDLSPLELRRMIARAIELKKEPYPGKTSALMRGQTAVLLFEKASTRTRVSFESGIVQLGGAPIFMTFADSQIARGEPIRDTARVLSRMTNLIIMRTEEHACIEQMAQYASVPVINALSDFNHPCQQLADIQTYIEHRGELSGRRVAWIGDGNNVCNSWISAAQQFDFHLAIATPKGYTPDHDLCQQCAAHIELGNDPKVAAKDVDLVVTDTWVSMTQEHEKAERQLAFAGFCVDDELMASAASDALFMHCMPAYRGYEVSATVADGAQSVIWDQAANRVPAQKALMEFLLDASIEP